LLYLFVFIAFLLFVWQRTISSSIVLYALLNARTLLCLAQL